MSPSTAEREDGDGRAADGEARRRHHRRHQTFKPFPAFRQFRPELAD